LSSSVSDLESLNKALAGFTGLQVAIRIVGEQLRAMQRYAQHYELHFGWKGDFKGASYHRESASCMLASHELLARR